ncbi:thioesterase family protein [Amycolatopsis sp. QT-25]|uniref:thioesterase family protein n=1 Tax=Amycolatopsis sp. QT-25 TaxID=3034022 RepID=UPI0023EA91DC|nr:thioesterase family protein [Amycolatopsis sp. QT-25]WET78296.1 thioesterase family protein [Amycolatopsis sp. QT-25]
MTAVLRPGRTVTHGRPAFEGANIRTWIGFKHFMYLVEQGVLQWLRDQGTSARDLFLEHGLGAEIVDCSVQLPAVLELDDEVEVEVAPGRGDKLNVQLSVVRDGEKVTVLRGKVTVALVRERAADSTAAAPEALARLEVPALTSTVERIAIPAGETAESVLTEAPGAFLWSWRAPYFYCHYSDRVQHSGFVRTLEEVVDRYLADRGISVGRMLSERAWIPVVSRARVRLLEDARMEETVHTVFTVTDILRGVMFDGRMDCYVQRGQELVPVATAQILHGYAIAAGPGAGGMAQLDEGVVHALIGDRA